MQDGIVIAADLPHLENMNKYAYDVIKTQVTDHFAGPDADTEPDFFTLKGDLFEMLKSRFSSLKDHTSNKAKAALDGLEGGNLAKNNQRLLFKSKQTSVREPALTDLAGLQKSTAPRR